MIQKSAADSHDGNVFLMEERRWSKVTYIVLSSDINGTHYTLYDGTIVQLDLFLPCFSPISFFTIMVCNGLTSSYSPVTLAFVPTHLEKG